MKEACKGMVGVMLVLIVFGVLACGGGSGDGGDNFDQGPTVVGSGNIVQDTRPVIGATGVELRGVANLTIEQGAPEQLILQTDDNLIALILTDVQGGILVIRSDPGFTLKPSQKMEALLMLNSIDSITLSGVGNITVPDLLTTTQLDLTLSGVGSIEIFDLDAQTSDVLLSGIGDIMVDGQVVDQLITLTSRSIGDYDAQNLSSEIVDVEIAGSGSATIRVSTTLNAKITGSGSVFYYGSPVVTRTGNGSGSVVQLSP